MTDALQKEAREAAEAHVGVRITPTTEGTSAAYAANLFARGYLAAATAREKVIEELWETYETCHASRVHADGCVLRLEHEIASLRAKLEAVPMEEIKRVSKCLRRNFLVTLNAELDVIDRWLAGLK